MNSPLADLRGEPGTPPRGPNSFNFMQFLGKNWLNNSFSHPPLELAPPPRDILDPPLVPLHFCCKFQESPFLISKANAISQVIQRSTLLHSLVLSQLCHGLMASNSSILITAHIWLQRACFHESKSPHYIVDSVKLLFKSVLLVDRVGFWLRPEITFDFSLIYLQIPFGHRTINALSKFLDKWIYLTSFPCIKNNFLINFFLSSLHSVNSISPSWYWHCFLL